jgi:hypothetical protein
VDAERRAAQRQGELVGERAAIEAQVFELHRCKSTLEMKWVTMIDLTKAQVRASVVVATIDLEGCHAPPSPGLARTWPLRQHF